MADPIVGDPDPQGLTKPGELHIEGVKRPVATEDAALGEAPKGAPQPEASAGQDKATLLKEAYDRGILPPEQKALYEEAKRRGLLTKPSESTSPNLSDVPNAAKNVTATITDLAKQREARALKVVQQLRGMSPDVDYDTGASYLAKIKVKDASNPQEAKLALERLYGKGNSGQDKAGNWWVDIDGKKTAVFGGGGGLTTGLSQGAAGLAASAPEAGGAITGGAIGAIGGPLGIAAGAGIGAVAGKGLDEFRKWLQGEFAKTPGDTAKEMAVTGAANTAFEGGGQLLGAGARGAMGALRSKFFEVTPQSRTVTRSLLEGGARPPLTTVGPGAKSFQYDQQLRNLIKGDPQRTRNVKYAMQRLHDVLTQGGVPDDQIEDVFSAIIDPRRAVSVRAESETVANAVKAHVVGLQNEVDTSLETARSIVDSQLKALEEIGNQAETADAHGAFVAAATESRREFSKTMTRAYDAIDEMVGGMEIIPTGGMKDAAKAVLEQMPKSGQPSIFHEIAELPTLITVKQAQRFRTRLNAESDSGNLTPGSIEHDYSETAKAFGAALSPEQAIAFVPEAKEALEALAKADADYAEGIAKYKDAKLNQMIRDFRKGKVLDAEAFAASLFDTKSTFRVKSFQQIVGPDVWKVIQAADARNLLKATLRLSPAGSQGMEISANALWTVIKSRGEMMDAIYGKDTANLWRQYSSRLADLNVAAKGIMPKGPVQPDILSNLLQIAVKAGEKNQELVANSILHSLQKGGPDEIDAAIDLLVRPGQEAQLEHVIKFFGDKNPEVIAAIRSAAIKKALSAAVTTDKSGIETSISGSAIDTFLSKYTRAEQQMLFPNGLDQDLRIVADQLKALFYDLPAGAGPSIAAANIKGKVPLSLAADSAWLRAAFKGWLADRPWMIRAIAGIPGPTSTAKEIRQNATRVLYRQFLNEQAQALGSTAQDRPNAR